MTYTTTVTPVTTPDGRPAFLIECTCGTHPAGMTRAIAVGPINGSPYPKANVHGAVVLAHHPVLSAVVARRGNLFKA